MVQLSHPYMNTGKTVSLTILIIVRKVMSLFFNILSRFFIAFLPRNKHLLISWLQSLSTVILETKKIKSATVSTSVKFSSVQSLSCVQLFVIPWTSAHQASLSITNSWSPPKPMSTESVMPPNHLILCFPFSSWPQSFPASGSFPMSQLFASGGQSAGVSASTPVLPMNTQDWSPLGWTVWISLQSKGLSRVFSNTTVQKHQFFCA